MLHACPCTLSRVGFFYVQIIQLVQKMHITTYMSPQSQKRVIQLTFYLSYINTHDNHSMRSQSTLCAYYSILHINHTIHNNHTYLITHKNRSYSACNSSCVYLHSPHKGEAQRVLYVTITVCCVLMVHVNMSTGHTDACHLCGT